MHLSRSVPHTALLTALHLLVDGLCCCSVLMLQPSLTMVGVGVLFLIYNVLAFMTQPLVGLWMDRRAQRPQTLWTVMLLLFGGALLTRLHPYCTTVPTEMALLASSALLLGMGNSLFHVWGGKYVTQRTDNDARHLGVFVSSGALGLSLGGVYHSLVLMVVLAVLMMATVYAFQRLTMAERAPHTEAEAAADGPTSPIAVGLLLFMLLLVFGRSFVGNVKPASVDGLASYAALAGVVAFVGKSSGGFIGRRFGVWTTLTAALMASGVCVLLAGLHWAAAVLMVLTINLTMPLTLHLANRSAPQRAGFAFGLLACILIPGHALGLLAAGHPLTTTLLYPLVGTIIIEALVLFALREKRWQVLAASVAMNVLTNVPLNLSVCTIPALRDSLPAHLVLEVVVLLVEAALFYLVTRERRTAWLYALLCNTLSYLSGVVFGVVYNMVC